MYASQGSRGWPPQQGQQGQQQQGSFAPQPSYPQQQGNYPPQQQGNYPPQQGGWQGQQQGGWGQQGQQPPAQYPCCPEDPNEHFCNTDPNQQGQNGQPPSSLVCLWQQCDASSWLVLLCLVGWTIGFGIVVGANSADNLLGHYGVSDAGALSEQVFWDNLDNVAVWMEETNGTQAPPMTPAPTMPPLQTVIVNGTRIVVPATTPPPDTQEQAQRQHLRVLLQAVNTSRPAAPTKSCRNLATLFGTFGSVCEEDSLSPMVMLMNQSRWINFRGTLYFLAMLCSLMLLVIIVIVNKQKAFLDAGGAQQAQGQYGAPVSPPYDFHGTPLYYSFRMAWGAVSVIIFFWIVTEMYQYWWFIDYYKSRTTGKLHDFWVSFDKKFVPATICVAIFLCWPIAHLCIELAFFIVGFIPWWGIKQVYVQLQMPSIDEEKPFDGHSCCIRTNMFYSDFHQAHRLGFSEGQWKMLTGSKEPFCRALECAPAQPYQGGMGGPPPQQQPPRPGPQMGSYPQPSQNFDGDRSVNRSGAFGPGASQSFDASAETPKKEKKSKKDKSEKKEKKDKKDKKDKHRSSVSVSKSFAGDSD